MGVLIDWLTETVKHEIKKTKGGILWVSCFYNATNDFFSSERYRWKMSWKSRKRIYEWNFLVSLHPLSNIEIIKYFSYDSRFNGVFQEIIYL